MHWHASQEGRSTVPKRGAGEASAQGRGGWGRHLARAAHRRYISPGHLNSVLMVQSIADTVTLCVIKAKIPILPKVSGRSISFMNHIFAMQ